MQHIVSPVRKKPARGSLEATQLPVDRTSIHIHLVGQQALNPSIAPFALLNELIAYVNKALSERKYKPLSIQ